MFNNNLLKGDHNRYEFDKIRRLNLKGKFTIIKDAPFGVFLIPYQWPPNLHPKPQTSICKLYG